MLKIKRELLMLKAFQNVCKNLEEKMNLSNEILSQGTLINGNALEDPNMHELKSGLHQVIFPVSGDESSSKVSKCHRNEFHESSSKSKYLILHASSYTDQKIIIFRDFKMNFTKCCISVC
jgi:hypothetical protein